MTSTVTGRDTGMSGTRDVDVDVSVDPWVLFAAAPTERAVAWRDPDSLDVIVGVGSATEITSRSPAVRFAEIAGALSTTDPTSTGDRWFGGFSFDCGHPSASIWVDHPCGALTLPSTTVTVCPTGRVRVTTRSPDAPTLDDLLDRARRHRCELTRPRHDDSAEERCAYTDLVSDALREIGSDDLEKVVLARRSTWSGGIDVAAVLADLAARHPSCAVFAFRRGRRVFLGATPELLLAHDGEGHISSAALAGSRPRGTDPSADERLAADLVADEKEQAEHLFVVEDIRRQLTAAGVRLDAPATTGVRRLEGIQHLHTPVTGRVDSESRHVVEILGAVHPSPAVCGTPTAAARRFIRDHEGIDRGWYAGPVGWIDGSGAASFHVALRSGLIELDTGQAHLFAGAGIVAGSRPDAELTETDVKLAALSRSLTS